MQIFVRDNNVEQALRILKKKMQREGVFREMKRRRYYEKPSERTTREKAEAARRARKLARKQAVRDGLIAPPRNKRIGHGTVVRNRALHGWEARTLHALETKVPAVDTLPLRRTPGCHSLPAIFGCVRFSGLSCQPKGS